jgi:DNA polymerase III alpha subunit
MGVSVGPGRGSAAGSVVAYCLQITNLDPIKYDLLFERFLNPERISLPDIDIDFDDEGRGRVIDWVVNKYGSENVAQIITYGTMADLPEAIDNITNLVSKIETFTLSRNVLLPKFDIPDRFVDKKDDEDGGKRGENEYLRHLTYQGAEERYNEITDDIKERIDFELEVVENSGYPGYFLIVQDFTCLSNKILYN